MQNNEEESIMWRPEVQITNLPSIYYLPGFAQITKPLGVSVSTSLKWVQKNTQIVELVKNKKQDINRTGAGICRCSINVSYHYCIIGSASRSGRVLIGHGKIFWFYSN